MIKKATFKELKYGDKLAEITNEGKLNFYTYLSRDPNWESRYCYLADMRGGSEHIHSGIIESKMYVYENSDIKKLEEMAEDVKLKIYRKWIDEHSNDTVRKISIPTIIKIIDDVGQKFNEQCKDSNCKFSDSYKDGFMNAIVKMKRLFQLYHILGK